MKNKLLLSIFYFVCCAITARGQQLKLSSYSSALATIYLDFDGEEVLSPMWNNGEPLICQPAGLTNTQIAEIFHRVAEDYRPFEINITTDIDVYNAAPLDKRIQVIITPTSSWFGNAGGVSYLSSFTWGDDTPCFVFCNNLGPNNPKMVAECSSHESGHALGLSHQSRYDEGCQLTAAYHDGCGSGETGWAPIMGNSYYKNMSGWSNGPTPYGCGSNQDNLSILTTQNGFGYRTDDHTDAMDQAASVIRGFNIQVQGIISTTIDKDVFTFTLPLQSNFNIHAKPFSTGGENEGGNLDIKISLYDVDKKLVRVYDPEYTMEVNIDTFLNAGKYFVVVDGAGNRNVSDYGSLGSYTVEGLYSVLPVCNIQLNGITKNNEHLLSWNISCTESIVDVRLQSSEDAVHFDYLRNVTGQSSFANTVFQKAGIYYRLQVTTQSGKVVFSSAVFLRSPVNNKNFIVPTIVSDAININAAETFRYQVFNAEGRMLKAGVGNAGVNAVPVQNLPAGSYVILLSGCGETISVRVLKL